MSSKKKLVISLSVAAAVLVAAIIAIVAVFAANAQTVQSTVKIKYTTSNVAGSVQASYQIKNEEVEPLGTSTFTATDTTTTALNDADITLTDANDTVTFTFIFTNNGGNTMYINLAQFTQPANTTVKYQVGTNTATDTLSEQSIVGRASAQETAKTCEIKVILSITDKAFEIPESTFDFAWNLTSTPSATVNP